MKKLYISLFTLFITAISFGQTILLLEEFSASTTPQYTLSMPEQIVSTTQYFTRTDGTNIASPINFADGESYFAVQDIDTSPMVSPATMLFDDVDIATYADLTFGVILAEHDASDGSEDWDSSDFVHFEYQIDNSGVWKNLIWVENDGATFNTAPQIDTNFDGVGDGLILTNEFSDEIFFAIPDTGTVIDIRVTFGGLTSADEDIAIDVIFLVDSVHLFPTATITSPTSSQIFSAGTTSVDLEYTTANSPTRVDIEVNGVITSNTGPTGPFNITTTDGETYNVWVLVFMDAVEVSDDFVTFSVESSLGIDENKNENFNIYPNPTSLGFINIKSKNNETIKASVFDILGKQVIRSTIIDNTLDVSRLNAGIYIIRITQNNATVTKKLVIN